MKLLLPFFFCLLPGLLLCQYQPTISSGRPGLAIGAVTVGREVYQVETGFNINRAGENLSLTDFTETTQIRVGILENLEVNGLLSGTSDERLGGERERGINTTELGVRYSPVQNDGWRPLVTLDGSALLTLQDIDFRRENTGARLTVAATWSLTDAVEFAANLNRTWTGNDEQRTGYVAALAYSLTERLGSFVELYGSFDDGITRMYDGGFTYLVRDDVAVDLSAGWQGTEGMPDYFLDFGISFRFDGRQEGEYPADSLPEGQ